MNMINNLVVSAPFEKYFVPDKTEPSLKKPLQTFKIGESLPLNNKKRKKICYSSEKLYVRRLLAMFSFLSGYPSFPVILPFLAIHYIKST